MRSFSVLIWVQHLLGIGHQRRAAACARALAAAGHEVHYVSGGTPVPGLDTGAARFVQLPAASVADAGYRALVNADGREVDPRWWHARREALAAAVAVARANVLITETYPFGRGLLRAECEALLASAAPGTLVLSSVRDILEPRADGARRERLVASAQRDFDGVLVHGDAAFAGQGVVAETLQFTDLEGYTTGGVIHIIINNQIGSTTSHTAARSSPYPSAPAKGLQAPMVHVHGDAPEAAVLAARSGVPSR